MCVLGCACVTGRVSHSFIRRRGVNFAWVAAVSAQALLADEPSGLFQPLAVTGTAALSNFIYVTFSRTRVCRLIPTSVIPHPKSR